MAYLPPPLFVRSVFNKLAMRFGISGAATLAVAGRKTGATQRIPVVPVEHSGARYLVSMRGEAEWVRNLRAAGGRAELLRGGAAEAFHATEIPAGERPPVIAAYRAQAGSKMVEGYFTKLPDPADHPTFRLDLDA